jgi:hypothetical protein
MPILWCLRNNGWKSGYYRLFRSFSKLSKYWQWILYIAILALWA